jgi:hypothetical protein
LNRSSLLPWLLLSFFVPFYHERFLAYLNLSPAPAAAASEVPPPAARQPGLETRSEL